MSEQKGMTPEEARDFNQKLLAFARELSPKQRAFLAVMLVQGAESAEVEGYIWQAMTPGNVQETFLCVTGKVTCYCSDYCTVTCIPTRDHPC